jgi:hypothetical protein
MKRRFPSSMQNVDLPKSIRAERARKKRKQPLEYTLFERIDGLVRAHALGEAFLGRLGGSREEPLPENVRFERTKEKEPYDPPRFPLSRREDFGITMAILERGNNPYLRYAASPDEILLSGPLFDRNPRLDPDILARHHFETLLLAEIARREIADLTGRMGNALEKEEPAQEDRSPRESLAERIGRLREFIAGVEGERSAGG